MRFRTEITPTPLRSPIRWGERLLAVGSCFSEHIAGYLAKNKFQITTNPTGVLFNPASIAQSIERWGRGEEFSPESFRRGGEAGDLWFHYELHGSLSNPDLEQAHKGANEALRRGHKALLKADRLLITFGTAWVYELCETGEVVANCHRQPHHHFRRRLLRTEEIVAGWSALLDGPLREKRLIMTLSPIRHLADGAEQNSLSKAILRVAIDELAARYPQIDYFPAYELLMDDLRDYRFYGEDLVHPSTQATAYIRERFTEAALDPEARQLVARIEAIERAMAHRPLHPHSEEHKRFCQKILAEIAQLEKGYNMDLSAEKGHFQPLFG